MKKIWILVIFILLSFISAAHAEKSDYYNQPIPKEYGRLAGVMGINRSSSLLFFEANDGTIRTVKIQACDKAHYRICDENLSYTMNRN